MQITYYHKIEESGPRIGSFGVYIPGQDEEINNLSVLKGKTSGWYIAMPNYKDKVDGKWKKVVGYGSEKQKRFLKTAREELEKYIQETGIAGV